MNIEELREFCLSFPGTGEKMPFDETTLVFTVGGKMFCLVDIVSFERINVKCDPETALELREQYDEVIPGYHMDKRHWNSVKPNGKVSDALLREWIEISYHLVIATLPKKLQRELEAL